jgi:hypothetical protein
MTEPVTSDEAMRLRAENDRLRAALLECAAMARQLEEMADRAAVRLVPSAEREAAMKRALAKALDHLETYPSFAVEGAERRLVAEMRAALGFAGGE